MTAAVTPFAKTAGLDHILTEVLQPPNMSAELLKPVHFHREKAAALELLAFHAPQLQALQQQNLQDKDMLDSCLYQMQEA
jgi:hypothetical protein